MKALLISALLVTTSAIASDYVVEFDKKLSKQEVKKLSTLISGQWNSFSYKGSTYFDQTMKLNTQISRDKVLKLLSGVKHFTKLEDVTQIEASSVIPATRQSLLANDPLVTFQWGLDFIDQKVINEVSDIENITLKGSTSADIEASNLDAIELKMKRETVVAVIDTGVDYDHPDLKDNIYQNTVECENGEIPFKPEVSLDDNKFPGDCKGWDFTGRGELGSNRPTDYVGHGTHIAGIISAVRNNNIGISGVSNKIKILPIKVLSNTKEEAHARGTSDRLAEAILYATQMKVDVINLSLGWPISFDKDHLRNAVLEALRANITVVAAAGNNDHSEPIFPCAYEGVICVGSIDPDSKLSDFTNFGGHVDVLAPGNNILSTYPTANTPLFFDLEGYELKSGTSQSAPFVSALAAVLKGIYPNISEDELKAKIYNSSKGPVHKSNKYSSGGKINFDKAIAFDTAPVIRPDFKNLSRIKVDLKTKRFSFHLNVKNFGAQAQASVLKLQNTGELLFDKTVYKLGKMNSGKTVTIAVSGRVSDIDAHLSQMLKLSINLGNTIKTFHNELRLFVDFNDNSSVMRYPILNAIPDEILSLNTINLNHGEFLNPAYYSVKAIKDQGVVVSIFEMKNDKIEKLGSQLIKDISQVISVHRMDTNFDGKTDYLIRSVVNIDEGEDKKTQTIQYAFFNEKFRPLFTKGEQNLSFWNLKFEKVILQDLDDFTLAPYETSAFGKILVPVFHAFAQTPEADENPNPFARLRGRVFSTKLFYFLPEVSSDGDVKIITRTFNTNTFIDDFKRRIRVKPFEQVYVLKMFKQSVAEIKAGVIKLLLTHEPRSGSAKNYIMTISDLKNRIWTIDQLIGDNQVNLSGFAIDRGINLSAETPLNHHNNLNIVASEKMSSTLWEQVLIKSDTVNVGLETIVQNNKLDPVQIPIKTYFDADSTYRFFQTPSRIFMHLTENGQRSTTSMPVHISSFLPGILFQEQHYPIVFKSDKSYPALYVDSTQIASKNIYTIIAKGRELKAPISLNVNVPDKCITKNPQVIRGSYHYALLCLKDNGPAEMIYFPVEEKGLN